MKKLLSLVKISAKESYQQLRKKSPLYSQILGESVVVGRTFYNHISYSKQRGTRELIERLLVIPLIKKILDLGEVNEKRNSPGGTFFRISKKIGKHKFTVIILKKTKEPFLLSCFLD